MLLKMPIFCKKIKTNKEIQSEFQTPVTFSDTQFSKASSKISVLPSSQSQQKRPNLKHYINISDISSTKQLTASSDSISSNNELTASKIGLNSSTFPKLQTVSVIYNKTFDLPKENLMLKQNNLKSNLEINVSSATTLNQNHFSKEHKNKKSSKTKKLKLPPVIFKTPNSTRHTFETNEYDEEKLFINDESYFYSSSFNNQPNLNTYYNFNKNKRQEICDFRLPKSTIVPPRPFDSKSRNSLLEDSLIWSKYKRTISKVYELRKSKENQQGNTPKSELSVIA